MNTLELNAELLHELSTIAADENLLRKAIKAIKALKNEKTTPAEPPCCYTVEEVKARLSLTMDDALHGRGISKEK